MSVNAQSLIPVDCQNTAPGLRANLLSRSASHGSFTRSEFAYWHSVVRHLIPNGPIK